LAAGKDRSLRMSDVTVSPAAMRIVKLLVGNPPQTISDLIETTGVTRTAITEQLNELVAAGFVERTVERLHGRGRPRHLYRATPAALLLLFASNQRVVVPAMWQAIEELGGARLAEAVLDRVSALVAEHYRRRITAASPSDRLRELAELLTQEGGLVEIDGAGQQLVPASARAPSSACMSRSSRSAGSTRGFSAPWSGSPSAA